MTELSRTIINLMANKNISAKELSAKPGIEYSTLLRLMSGKNNNPYLDTLRAVAVGLGVSLTELFGAVDNRKRRCGNCYHNAVCKRYDTFAKAMTMSDIEYFVHKRRANLYIALANNCPDFGFVEED